MIFYNEFDKNAAQWLRNLGEAGEISHGVVDERSIRELSGADLAGVRHAHFFAGGIYSSVHGDNLWLTPSNF